MAGVHFRDAAAPDGMRIYAIGDVHGRIDLLMRLHERIEAELVRDQPADWRIIHLGDYVDRGPDSRSVIEFLLDRQEEDARHIALKGNHDQRFVMFLRDIAEWPNFENFGGRTTARSYGVDFGAGGPLEIAVGHERLRQLVPTAHVGFLDMLPLSITIGDFFFCHAGIRPGILLEEQTEDDLLWIRRDFHAHQSLHPKLIVHGHTPVREPDILPNRVNLDTLAWETGRLTALAIDGKEKRLLATADI